MTAINSKLLWYSSCVAILLLRCHTTLLQPELLYEDATELFGFYYSNRDFTDIFKYYNGYIALLPNIVGYLAHWFGPSIAAFTLTWFPFVLACVAHTLFLSHRYEYVASQVWVRGIFCLVSVLLPLSKNALLLNTSYSIWSSVFILALLYLLPLSKVKGFFVLQMLVMSLLICSNPISVLLLPLCLVQLLKNPGKQNQIGYGVLFVVSVLYLIFGINGVGYRGFSPELIGVGLVRTAFEGFFGTRYTLDLYALSSTSMIVCSVVIILSLHLIASRRLALQLLLTIAWLLPISALLSRNLPIQIALEPELHRYFYPARMMLLLVFISALARLTIWHRQGLTAAIGFVCLYLVLHINGKNDWLYRDHAHRAAEVQHFIEEINTGVRPAVLNRGPMWSVKID